MSNELVGEDREAALHCLVCGGDWAASDTRLCRGCERHAQLVALEAAAYAVARAFGMRLEPLDLSAKRLTREQRDALAELFRLAVQRPRPGLPR